MRGHSASSARGKVPAGVSLSMGEGGLNVGESWILLARDLEGVTMVRALNVIRLFYG